MCAGRGKQGADADSQKAACHQFVSPGCLHESCRVLTKQAASACLQKFFLMVHLVCLVLGLLNLHGPVTSWLNKPLISPRFQRGNRKKAEKEKVTVIFEEKPRDHESEPGSESDSDGGLGAEDTLFEVGADSIEQDEELKLHCMGCNSYFTAVIETNFGNVTKNLPTRWLPPGTIRMLYMKMQMENQDHGSFKISYSHFWRVFRKRWHNVIRFLPESTHGACDDCASLKQQFARSQDPQSKFNAAKAYQSHLDLVYKDRDLEAFLQSANPLTRSQQPLCLHWDSFRFQSP